MMNSSRSSTNSRESARPRGYRDTHDHNIALHRGERKRSRSRSQSPPRRYGRKYKSDRHARSSYSGRDDGADADQYRHEHERSRVDADEERRVRMAKLRAENEEEERRLEAEAAVANSERNNGNKGSKAEDEDTKIKEFTEEDLEGLTEEEKMMKMMGIGVFGSTKGKAVKDNQVSASKGACAKSKARKYRQYMNRKGGFNRPLDKMN
uniref:U4/U6.U5 small nuclear ribonucleoprotein 27kDa protein domain-containing protein n=1 Tax=Leptocylindrus danicus TaxID=163516 RepID=A0A7S2K6S7_9STRA